MDDRDLTDSPAVLEAVRRARQAYLDEAHAYGCAETTFAVLVRAYGLQDVPDTGPAMALNGGIAWTGGPCGAVTGAALAVGMLASSRIPDHGDAKRAARELVAGLLRGFELEFGALACRDLIGMDLRVPGAHAAFLAGEMWREVCMRQIEWTVRQIAPLAEPAAWDAALAELATEAG